MEKNIKFSVVIPTRERCITLEQTIHSCFLQDYEDFEIIVSDNFSQDDTKKIVEKFNDKRVKYINTGKRVSMSHNWEFALEYISGDFVTFVGDDDALIPNALSSIAKVIKETDVEAVVWNWASYFWPDAIDEKSRNLLIIPTKMGFEIRYAKRELNKLIRFETSYNELPFLYKGAVRVDKIKSVIENSKGKFFYSMTPDIYSAIAISTVVDKYCYSYQPFSINGTSGNSNGASQFSMKGKENELFSSENNIPFHADASYCLSVPMLVAEALYQVRDNCLGQEKLMVDPLLLVKASLTDIKTAPIQRRDNVISGLRSYAIKHGVENQLEEMISSANFEDTSNRKVIGMEPGFNFRNKIIVVKSNELNVKNVRDAALLCEFIINSKSIGYGICYSSIIKTTINLIILYVRDRVFLRLKKYKLNAH